MGNKMEGLLKEAFDNLNGFKRARTLEMVSREDGNYDKASVMKLRQYEHVDRLELALRAIQKEYRNSNKEGQE